jgi:hypothetical protein
MLVQHLEKWASDPSTAGGAFSLSKDSLKPATSRRGSYQLIKCHRGGKSRAKMKNPTEVQRETQKPSAKVECPWGVYIESTDIGWIVTKPSLPALIFAQNSGCLECLAHEKHDPIEASTQLLLYPGLRAIPDELHELASHLQEGNMGGAEIYHTLIRRCLKDNISVTFTMEDVKNKYGTSTFDKILDCSNLAEHLKLRFDTNPELQYNIYLDSDDGTLERVFFVLNGGKDSNKIGTNGRRA